MPPISDFVFSRPRTTNNNQKKRNIDLIHDYRQQQQQQNQKPITKKIKINSPSDVLTRSCQEYMNFIQRRVMAFAESRDFTNPANYYRLVVKPRRCSCTTKVPMHCFSGCSHINRSTCAGCIHDDLMVNCYKLVEILRRDSETLFRWSSTYVKTLTMTTTNTVFPSPSLREGSSCYRDCVTSAIPDSLLMSSVSLSIRTPISIVTPVQYNHVESVAEKMREHADLELIALEFIVLNYWYLWVECPVCDVKSKAMFNQYMSSKAITEFVKRIYDLYKLHDK